MQQDPLSTVSFKDTAFLQQFGLHQLNALDYFSQSQFYDRSCINEQLKMQARFNELEAENLDHTKMVGIEFELWYFTYEPSYFVIRKSHRYSATKTELLQVYYIIEGTIYQAPNLDNLLTNRLYTSLYFINKAFDKTVESTRFHPFFGEIWDFEEKEIERKHQELVDIAEREPLTFIDEKRNFETLRRIDQAIFDAFKATAKVDEQVSEKVKSPDDRESRSKVTVAASTLRADSIVAIDEVSLQSSAPAIGKKKRRRESSLGTAGSSKKKEKSS